jgi:hypothetical protein
MSHSLALAGKCNTALETAFQIRSEHGTLEYNRRCGAHERVPWIIDHGADLVNFIWFACDRVLDLG